MKRVVIAICMMMFFFSASEAGELDITGYYKMFFTAFKPAPVKGGSVTEPPIGAVNNRLRLKLSMKPAAWISVHASYDFSPRIQDTKLFAGDIFFSRLTPGNYRVADFDQRLYPAEGKPVSSFAVFHNFDRLFVTIKTAFADIFIGRQAIAWGSGKFNNPTDIVAPFTFNELDTEERSGVDAIRVRIPLGMMSELDLGYIPGDDFKSVNSAFYIRGMTNLLETDVSLLLMGFREHLLLGLDLTRSIGGAGFWFEAAYVDPFFFYKNKGALANENDYARASIGLDYTFSSKTYGFFEYHFNSAGNSHARNYLDAFDTSAYRDGSVYLMGKHYLNLGITYQVTPLIPFTGMVIMNLNDGSFTLAPSFEYNIKEDIYVGFGAYLGIGKRMGTEERFRSEFGAYPNMVYTSFRIYF